MEGIGLFRKKHNGEAIPCRLYLAGDQLNIYLENPEKEMFIWNIQRLHSRDWNNETLVLEYGSTEIQQIECKGVFAAELDHKAHIFFNTEPIKRQTIPKKIWIPILLLVLVLALAFLVWFYIVPWVGEKAANLVPVETEISLGKNMSQMYVTEAVEKDSASVYIQQFTDKLQLDDTYPIRVHVIRSEEINAFAVPGGNIFVYSGIINKMKSYEELVALLGHEVTHVQNRHSLKSICRSVAGSILLSSLFGDLSGVTSVLLSEADRFKELDYSRDLETEADDNGLQIMRENKVSVQGMLDLLELLKREGAETPGLMKYLSTHPDTQARIDNVRSKIQEVPAQESNLQLENAFRAIKRTIDAK